MNDLLLKYTRGIPPGWNYNPSAWSERLPLVGIAMLGFFIAGYLSLFQLKLFDHVWEPFFGNGSRKILTSGISKALPVPDALLGTIGYLADAVSGILGGEKKWKTQPWIVFIRIGPKPETAEFYMRTLAFILDRTAVSARLQSNSE